MTREEAIQVLQTALTSPIIYGEYALAIGMAIEALSQPIVCKDYRIDDDHIYCSPEVADRVVEALSADRQTGWIPVSERLPKKNEYVDDVCKYYLIQDEYGDMHVAHLSGRGWEHIESIRALGCDVVAWMPLPEPYREDDEK